MTLPPELIAAGFTVCGWCGTQGPPVALQRADGRAVVSYRSTEHALDCPYYRPPCQPEPLGAWRL